MLCRAVRLHKCNNYVAIMHIIYISSVSDTNLLYTFYISNLIPFNEPSNLLNATQSPRLVKDNP